MYPTVLLLNQVRYKMAVMFGSSETMPGGNAPLHLSAMTVRISAKRKQDPKVNPQKAAYAEVAATIRKYKRRIFSDNAEWLVALQDVPHLNLKTGQSHDAATALHYMEYLGMLRHEGAKWFVELGDGDAETFKKKDDVKHRLMFDAEFAQAAKGAVVAKCMESA